MEVVKSVSKEERREAERRREQKDLEKMVKEANRRQVKDLKVSEDRGEEFKGEMKIGGDQKKVVKGLFLMD
jgi:hypothetical protein